MGGEGGRCGNSVCHGGGLNGGVFMDELLGDQVFRAPIGGSTFQCWLALFIAMSLPSTGQGRDNILGPDCTFVLIINYKFLLYRFIFVSVVWSTDNASVLVRSCWDKKRSCLSL